MKAYYIYWPIVEGRAQVSAHTREEAARKYAAAWVARNPASVQFLDGAKEHRMLITSLDGVAICFSVAVKIHLEFSAETVQ